jgi:tight adherence protein C
MILLLLIGIVLTGIAIGTFAHVTGWSDTRQRSFGVPKQVEAYGFTQHEQQEESAASGVRGVVDELATKLGSAVGSGKGRPNSRVQRDLVAAGLYHITPGRFTGYRLLLAGGLPLLWIWLAVSIGAKPVAAVLLTLLLGFAGWWLPTRALQTRAEKRLSEIDYQLPELIDLLVVTIEAGLGFVGSVQTAAGRVSGPLGEELRLTLQEQSMGLSIQEALLHMLDRCDTPSMRSFVRSVVQGERLGVSIGQIMRDLAHEMRRRRYAIAQEKAQKAPIKLLFPLVFLIFPAMFVILLGPAMFLFFRAISGA